MLRKLRLIAALLLVSACGSTTVFYFAEHGANPRIAGVDDALWWWFVSSTTVGYGDIAPATSLGRLAGVITILVGVFCYTNFVAITADSLQGLTDERRLGTAKLNLTGHILICEYTAFADELIQALPRYPDLARREVAIVTDLVQVRPYPQHHFVRGVPISPAALQQASIGTAAIIFVFANIRFVDPDLKTLHTATRVRQLAPHAKLFVELNDPAHELARHLDANTVVLSSRDLLASVMRDHTIDLTAHFARG
jgi:hypothetical protein